MTKDVNGNREKVSDFRGGGGRRGGGGGGHRGGGRRFGGGRPMGGGARRPAPAPIAAATTAAPAPTATPTTSTTPTGATAPVRHTRRHPAFRHPSGYRFRRYRRGLRRPFWGLGGGWLVWNGVYWIDPMGMCYFENGNGSYIQANCVVEQSAVDKLQPDVLLFTGESDNNFDGKSAAKDIIIDFQKFANSRKYTPALVVDGIYGKKTEAAIKKHGDDFDKFQIFKNSDSGTFVNKPTPITPIASLPMSTLPQEGNVESGLSKGKKVAMVLGAIAAVSIIAYVIIKKRN